jgi:hypothetical protein
MKKYNIFGILVLSVFTLSCTDLNLNPLSQGSSQNWYRDKTEYQMSANYLLNSLYYPVDSWSDDITDRISTTDFLNGNMTSQTSEVCNRYGYHYKAITDALTLLEHLNDAKEKGLTDEEIKQYKGEAYFLLGFSYGMLATYWGDAVLYKNKMSLDDAFKATRSPRQDVFNFAYECLDSAATNLPISYTGEQRPTKGAALGFKVRFALFNGDYKIVTNAAEKCMSLGVYKLAPNYAELFKSATSPELMFYMEGSTDLKISVGIFSGYQGLISRKVGGYLNMIPTFDLFYSYLCTDGRPIDESPLYNPKDPFANRDPRLAYTIQPFKTKYSSDFTEYEKSKEDGTFSQKYPEYCYLGYEFNPNPYAITLYDTYQNKLVPNLDSKSIAEYASFTGLIMKKYVKDDWINWRTNKSVDNVFPYLRYAEVLMSYVEAKNELGECTQNILDSTINKVRARAYNGSGITYPRVMMDTQEKLRKIIRMERRMEFAFEGLRYRDLLRWKIADKIFSKSIYYHGTIWSGSSNWNGKTGSGSNVALSESFEKELRCWDEGSYPIAGIPNIDENGIPDISEIAGKGYYLILSQPKFDPSKNYLWPIPAADLIVDSNLIQNPGY